MRSVEYSTWLLPPRPGSGPRARPYASSWKMNAQEAAAIGALSVVLGTTEVRELPETEEERQRAQVAYQSAGGNGVRS